MSYAPTSYCTVALEKKKKKKKKKTKISRVIFAREHYSAKISHVSQTFLSEKTQVFWLNKKTCFHGKYQAYSVSRSAISAIIDCIDVVYTIYGAIRD